jgi:hypothetical protein
MQFEAIHLTDEELKTKNELMVVYMHVVLFHFGSRDGAVG